MWSDDDIYRLKSGLPPENGELLRRLSTGIDFITDFWLEQYLDEYIKNGGSKIKFITGGPGSGKSHCLNLFLYEAAKRGYKTVSLSAKTTWIHDFKEIYAAVLKGVDLDGCLLKCADAVIHEMGYEPSDVSSGMSFADFMAGRGQFDPITRRELRSQLNVLFYKNQRMDKNFAISAALVAGGKLGHPLLEPSAGELLSKWFAGEKGLRATELRKLGLSGAKITKHNARHMLRSLVEVIKMAGYPGLVIGIDDLEMLTSTGTLEEIRYTKMRREDAYESIRELIDELDGLGNVMFVFAMDRELLENENAGFKSYQALWMRIQNEVEGPRFNRFADIIDLDRLSKQHYTPDTLADMSARLANVVEAVTPIGPEAAAALISESAGERCSLPRRINRITLGEAAI